MLEIIDGTVCGEKEIIWAGPGRVLSLTLKLMRKLELQVTGRVGGSLFCANEKASVFCTFVLTPVDAGSFRRNKCLPLTSTIQVFTF